MIDRENEHVCISCGYDSFCKLITDRFDTDPYPEFCALTGKPSNWIYAEDYEKLLVIKQEKEDIIEQLIEDGCTNGSRLELAREDYRAFINGEKYD
jgi:hypothetical protein